MKIFKDKFTEWLDSEIGKPIDGVPLTSRNVVLAEVRLKLNEVIKEEYAKILAQKESEKENKDA